MQITNGNNILILRKNGTYVSIPDAKDISKNIPLDAEIAFINISLNELVTYLAIPIDNLVTKIYSCTAEYSFCTVDYYLLQEGQGFDYSIMELSDIIRLDINTITEFYTFVNSLDTIGMLNDMIAGDAVDLTIELCFNNLKIDMKSDRYNIKYDMHDNLIANIDEFSSATIGISNELSTIFDFTDNRIGKSFSNLSLDEFYNHSIDSFLIKPKKNKYERINVKNRSTDIDEYMDNLKPNHVVLYRVTHSYAGDIYIAINKYEYMVLNSVTGCNLYIFSNIGKYENGRCIVDNELLDYDYQEQIENFLDSQFPFWLNTGGQTAMISLLYQFECIVKLALSFDISSINSYNIDINNVTLQSQMGLHLVYYQLDLNRHNPAIYERCAIFEEDYKLSYRYIFTQILREINNQ